MEKRKKKERKEKKKEKHARLKKQQSQSDKEGRETAGDTDNTALNDSQEETVERTSSKHSKSRTRTPSPMAPKQHEKHVHSPDATTAVSTLASQTPPPANGKQKQLEEDQGFDLYGDIGDHIEYPSDELHSKERRDSDDYGLNRSNMSPGLNRSDSILDIHAPIDFDVDADTEKDVFAAIPEPSKWERDEDVQASLQPIERDIDIRSTGEPGDEKSEVTTDVIKRAEYVIFTKAIKAIQGSNSNKRGSSERQRLYNKDDATPPKGSSADVVLVGSPSRHDNYHTTVQSVHHIVDNALESSSLVDLQQQQNKNSRSRDRSPSKTVRSIKDRLGKKVDDEPRSRTHTPPRKPPAETMRNRRSRSRSRGGGSSSNRRSRSKEKLRRDEKMSRDESRHDQRRDDDKKSGDSGRRVIETKRGSGRDRSPIGRNDKPRGDRSVDRARELARAREKERQMQQQHQQQHSRSDSGANKRDRSHSAMRNDDRDNDKRRKETSRVADRDRDRSSHRRAESSGDKRDKSVAERSTNDARGATARAAPKVSVNKRSHSPSDDSGSSSSSSDSDSDSSTNSDNKRRKKRKNKKQKKSKRASTSDSDDDQSGTGKHKKRKSKKSKKKKKTKK